jgi:sterol desaturase/sphingolipid hydroxylase (fatty acid hydroxylase superfamily)
VLELLIAPADFFMDAGKRVYWLYLLSALVVASVAVSIQEGRFDPAGQLKKLFDSRYWFARSSIFDVCLMLINSIVKISLLIPLFGSHLAATILVGAFFQDTFGDAPQFELGWFWIGVLFSTVFFVIEDFSRFCLHFCMHRFDSLWFFHRTHHSATVLTPLTLFRVHPVEHILYFARSLIVFGLVSGIFVWLFSQRLTGLQILGVDVFGFLFNFAAANLRHSHIWISFGRLEKVFISPAQHQLHHSVGNSNSNLGSVLSIWDGVLGTRVYAREKKLLEFGLGPNEQRSSGKNADGKARSFLVIG